MGDLDQILGYVIFKVILVIDGWHVEESLVKLPSDECPWI